MKDGNWRTLAEILVGIGGVGTEAAVSARLRDCRKEKFGSHSIERRRRGGQGGLYEYRLVLRSEVEK
jgi:hypothetical protein